MAEPETTPPSPAGQLGHWLNRTVFDAGVTSALGDLTYETTNVILPGFLAVLGMPPAILGTIEGVAESAVSCRVSPSGCCGHSSRPCRPSGWRAG